LKKGLENKINVPVEQKEEVLRGLPISQGVAIGTLIYFSHELDMIPEITVRESMIEKEIERYRRVLVRCKQDLKRLKKQFKIDQSQEAAAILETHIQILSDPLLTDDIEKKILSERKNAEWIFHEFIQESQKKFNQIDSNFFRERGKDLIDIARRILSYLLESGRISLSQLPKDTVVYADELAASDVAEAKTGSISAFLSDLGGTTSHASIVAKAKGLPYIASISQDKIKHAINTVIIVDGRNGDVILFPSEKTLEKYRIIQEQLQALFKNLETTSSLESETYDGFQMKLSANIEMINEIDLLHQYGGYGVGLFRSEYIFLSKQNFPTEEEQYVIYRSIIERMRGLPITIRTFDVGGDKLTVEQQKSYQGNPYLGCRALRFLLKERGIFKAQLKAILRASEYGSVSVMFPMVSGLPELLEAKKVISEAQEELRQEGKHPGEGMQIGCMIEIPSAAMIADLIAKECDFISIGTNDLIQYSLAVDRSNQIINMLYTPMHPGVIRLIKLIIQLASPHNVKISVCGEIAADPRFTPLLMGLGVQELSVSLRNLPSIKKVIRNTSIIDAYHLAEKVLTLNSPSEILETLTKELRKNLPEDFLHLSPFDLLQEEIQPLSTEEWEG